MQRFKPQPGRCECYSKSKHQITCSMQSINQSMNWSDLSLSEWNGLRLQSESSVLGELEQRRHRICARRQHKDERGATRGVCERTGQVKGRRLDELLTHLSDDELLHGRHHLVRAQRAQDHELVEPGKRVEWSRERKRVRKRTVVDFFPLSHVLLHIWYDKHNTHACTSQV